MRPTIFAWTLLPLFLSAGCGDDATTYVDAAIPVDAADASAGDIDAADAASGDIDAADASAGDIDAADASAGDVDAADAAPVDGSPDGEPLPPDAAPFVGNAKYVIRSFDLPTTSSQAQALAFDLDGNGAVDNAFGGVFVALAGQGAEIEGPTNAAIASGNPLQLLALDGKNPSDVILAEYLGVDSDEPADPSDNFSGSELFFIAESSPLDRVLFGTIDGATAQLHGRALVGIVFLGAPVILSLNVARIEAELGPDGAHGRIGGAVSGHDMNDQVYPALAAGFEAIVSQCSGAPPACCPNGSQGSTVLALFDVDDDCHIGVAELYQSAILTSVFMPDLDLFDANGQPQPDGVMESLSLGIGFDAVGADIALPE